MPADRPEDDLDEQFRRIVDGWDTTVDAESPPWPVQEDTDDEPARAKDDDQPYPEGDLLGRPQPVDDDPVEEEHYVPPPPPPVPRPDRVTGLAMAGAIGAPLALLLATLAQVILPRFVVGVLVTGFVVGIVTLIWRMDRRPRDPQDPGAVV